MVFIFGSCEENGYYRVVSVGQHSFNCRSHCGRSRRMQGTSQYTQNKAAKNICIGEKVIIRLTFNPRLALTDFRTT